MPCFAAHQKKVEAHVESEKEIRQNLKVELKQLKKRIEALNDARNEIRQKQGDTEYILVWVPADENVLNGTYIDTSDFSIATSPRPLTKHEYLQLQCDKCEQYPGCHVLDEFLKLWRRKRELKEFIIDGCDLAKCCSKFKKKANIT